MCLLVSTMSIEEGTYDKIEVQIVTKQK